MHNDSDKISASEINRYVYCPYQWYYERYYGRKYLREKRSEKNKALGYTDATKSNFRRGLDFHENYMQKYKTRRLIKMIIQIIIAVAIVLLTVWITKNAGAEIRKAPPELRISGYKLFYADQRKGNQKDGVIYSKQLTSEKYGLYGKPDFIFRRKNMMIPVELKSGSGGEKPHKGDMMQLCAYMLIISDVYSSKVPEGRLIYKDKMFIIKNTKGLNQELLKAAGQMRRMLKTGNPPKGEIRTDFAHCRYCGCRDTVCERI